MATEKIYLVEFNRFHAKYPKLEESVWVVLETSYSPLYADDGGDELAQWEREAFTALWQQYPGWRCPYDSTHQPSTTFEKLRHGWSSVFLGEFRIVDTKSLTITKP